MIRFERSLRLDDARDSGALLAYAMNGEALPIQHGYPLRVIVRGDIGQMADGDRDHRRPVRRILPERQIPVRVGAQRKDRQRTGCPAAGACLDHRACVGRRSRAWRCSHSRSGMVRRGTGCSRRGERRWRALAGGSSGGRTATPRLAVVGVDRPPRPAGPDHDSCLGDRSHRPHAAGAAGVEPAWVWKQRHPRRAGPPPVAPLRRSQRPSKLRGWRCGTCTTPALQRWASIAALICSDVDLGRFEVSAALDRDRPEIAWSFWHVNGTAADPLLGGT